MRTPPADFTAKLVSGADRLDLSFDDLRMEDIASATGIPRATLYYYFATKMDVLESLHQALLAEYRATVYAEPEGPAQERLRVLFERHFDHVSRHRGVSQLIVANIGRLGKLSELVSDTFDPLSGAIEDVLREAMRTREIADIDAARDAAAISVMAHVSSMSTIAAGDLGDGAEFARWLVGLVWSGVGAAPGE
jgi:AcrR family transcriptional regulator